MSVSISAHQVTRIESEPIRSDGHAWTRIWLTFADGRRERIDVFPAGKEPLRVEDGEEPRRPLNAETALGNRPYGLTAEDMGRDQL